MAGKLLVTLRGPEHTQAVHNSGCEVLAEYPDSLLVRATPEQQDRLEAAGLEVAELPEPAIQLAGAAFDMASAVAAETAAPVATDPNRISYFIVSLIGPPKGEWLETIRGHGGAIQSNMPGFKLLVGLLPAQAQALRQQPWVEAITPYRPAMKVSHKLRPGVGRMMSAEDLTAVSTAAGIAAAPQVAQQVQISVFPGESTAEVAAVIRESGGRVLEETPQVVTAVIPPDALPTLAAEPGVQAILPHDFPTFRNDRARMIMGVPLDHSFGAVTLRGTGQIVAVADSGLDTGDPATIHADFRGRVAGIVSWPNRFGADSNDLPPFDDGPSDPHSAHGTHVAGSVLGNGSAAATLGSTFLPQGAAPEARVFFQAIEQAVNWKPGVLRAAVGLWGIPTDLRRLLDEAYVAGARIHTNSWGVPSPTLHGIYTSHSANVDDYMWQHRDMLVLFSAGNSGVDVDDDGRIDNDSIEPPGTAKNCVTVGASENNRPAGSSPTPGINANWSQLIDPVTGLPAWPALAAGGHVSDNIDGLAAFSSRGTTDDLRIKPDVVAPGTNVLSVRSSVRAAANPLWGDLPAAHPLRGIYCWSGGTSMATPLVAGAAALIRQHLIQQRGHFAPGLKPSGALIKAFLVNGAASMAGQFPGEIPAARQNGATGFGRVNVMGSLAPATLQQTLFADEPEHAVESLQTRTYEVQAVDPAQAMKVTLVWTDAPGLPDHGVLQNTLYLQVRRPDGVDLQGDVTAFPTVQNNVQQVIDPAPIAGTYEIRVRGVNVVRHAPAVPPGPNPRQDFALAVSNAMGLSVNPVSIAQAIDTTGSMGFFGYMEPAKERARQLADFLRINDKVAITEFSRRPGQPDARTPYPLRLLGTFDPDWRDAHRAIEGLTADGTTPIGAGLLEAWNQLDNEPAARPRAIVLLSDGLNNVPPDPASVLAAIPAEVPIFCIALGPAGSAPALHDIANSRPNGQYYSVESDEDVHKLHEIYAQVQALAAGGALVGLSSARLTTSRTEHRFDVGLDAAEATFSLSWEGGGEMGLQVVGPDGRTRDAGQIGTAVRSGKTHRQVRIGVPLPGTWTMRVGGSVGRSYTAAAAVQSTAELNVQVAQAGDRRIAIMARLRRGDKPWDDAAVTARLTMPTRTTEEILGEFGDEIRGLRLPAELDEPGLTPEQRLSTQLALFARRRGTEGGGVSRRRTREIQMQPQGNGTWTAEAQVAAAGAVTVEVLAGGVEGGTRWERYATQGVLVPEASVTGPSLRIQDVRVLKRRGGARISALVLDNSSIARPGEGTQVNVLVTSKGGQQSLPMSYNPRTRLYSVQHDEISGDVVLEVVVNRNEQSAQQVLRTHV